MFKKEKHCSNCGHLSIILNDEGHRVPGCSAVKIVYDEMLKDEGIGSTSFSDDTYGEKTFQFEAIDREFSFRHKLADENDDCMVWTKQTPDQKKALKIKENKEIVKDLKERL